MSVRELFLFVVFCITDCKKYPEGPWISFRTKETRLLGSWKVQKYLIDGADLTAVKYPNLSANTCYFGFSHTAQYAGDSCDSIDGKWSFDNNRTHLAISTKSLKTGSLFLAEAIEWEIMRLTNKELHLKTTFSSKEYEIFAKKIN